MQTWLIVQVVSCAFLTGLIWTVQLAHYPAFSYVSEDRFPSFHKFHSRAITWVVAPAMSMDLLAALALFGADPNWLWASNLTGALAAWIVTALVSVPIHGRLARGYSAADIQRLTQTNWARTALWSARTIALTVILVRA